jgi:hypothetical protein
MGLHLLAGGLVWLVPLSGPVHWRAELVNRLSRLPETFLPDILSSAPEAEVSDHDDFICPFLPSGTHLLSLPQS